MAANDDVQDVIGRLKRRGEYEELVSEGVALETDALGFSLVGELSDEQVASLWNKLDPEAELSTDQTQQEVQKALSHRATTRREGD